MAPWPALATCMFAGLAPAAYAQVPEIDCGTISEISWALESDLPYYRSFRGQTSGFYTANLRRFERMHGLPDGSAPTQLVEDAIRCRYFLPEGERTSKVSQYICNGIAFIDGSAATTDMEAFGRALTDRFFACPTEKTVAHLDRERETRTEADGTGTVHVQSFWASGSVDHPNAGGSAFIITAGPLDARHDGRVIPVVRWSLGWSSWDR